MGAQPLFDRVALIGIGLIGSSLARAIAKQKLANTVVCATRSQGTADKALELGIVAEAGTDIGQAVAGADLVVICTPVGTYRAVCEAMAGHLKDGAIVSDVGSVKAAVTRDMCEALPDSVHVVPAHPVAGTEHSGPEAGFAELFSGRWCILTPPEGADQAAIDKVAVLWQACGMMVDTMTPDHHDQVLAITSHLPHLIAYTIVGTAFDLSDDIKQEVVAYSAGGFRDFTRIAASDPVMWRDIFLANKESVLEMLGRFTEDLTALQRAIRRDNGELLEDHFRRTREIRRGVIEAKQDNPDVPPEDTPSD